MLLENPIGWCDATGNLVIGCDKVSPGCAHCYAENDTPARVLRAGKWPGYEGQKIETWGPKGQRIPVQSFEEKVRRLNHLCICDTCHHTAPIASLSASGGEGRGEVGLYSACPTRFCPGPLRRIRFFPNSNSDWLDDRWSVEDLRRLLRLLHECRNIDWLLLTKRPENFHARMEAAWAKCDLEDPAKFFALHWSNAADQMARGKAYRVEEGQWTDYRHVWFGVSVENQQCADARIPHCAGMPAGVRWLSCEPLLESINLFTDAQDPPRPETAPAIDWVVVGGESSQPKRPARRCNITAIREIVDLCRFIPIPVYVKQLGSVPCWDIVGGLGQFASHVTFTRDAQVDLIHLRDRAGADLSEWPLDLRVRQFPQLSTP